MTTNVEDLPRLDLAAGSVPLSLIDDTGFAGRRFADALIHLFARHDMAPILDGEVAKQTLTVRDWIGQNGPAVIWCFHWGSGAQIYFALPTPLFAGLFEQAFGGEPMNFGSVTPTPLQRRFARGFGQELAGALSRGWDEGVVPLPELMQAAFDGDGLDADSQPCIAVNVPFTLGAHRFQASALFPADRLSAMRVTALPDVQRRAPDGDWRERLRKRAGHVHLPVRSILARPEIPAARLLTLRVGDMLPIAFSPSLPVLVGQQLFAHGRMGESNGCAAIRIDQLARGALS